MDDEELFIALAVAGLTLLFFYVYITSVSKALQRIGFSKREAGTILFVTLLFGWIPIPLVLYNGWWVGISIGGALIPLVICGYFIRTKRVNLTELAIGILIVTYMSYFITRAEEGVGIVADIPIAFAPAIAAGLFSLSVFWVDIRQAAPLAYCSGIIGTILGADIFHLNEVLSFPAPTEGFPLLVIGGANIYDMVYITGVVAVSVDIVAFWIRKQEAKHGMAASIAEFQRGGEGLPYARDFETAPKLQTGRKGRLQ
jgi:uncharacterized membrane protein